jgi:hypothetical protein
MALTVRLTEKDELLIEKLKKITGTNSAARALLLGAEIAVKDHPELKQKYIDLNNKHEDYETVVDQKLRNLESLKQLVKEIFNDND